MEDSVPFVVSREDWSLHRKGYQDQTRHQEKVKEAIKKNLPDLVSEENIIMSNGRDVIKIPIRLLMNTYCGTTSKKESMPGKEKGTPE